MERLGVSKSPPSDDPSGCGYVGEATSVNEPEPRLGITVRRRSEPTDALPRSNGSIISEEVPGLGAPAAWITIDTNASPPTVDGQPATSTTTASASPTPTSGQLIVKPRGYLLAINASGMHNNREEAELAAQLILAHMAPNRTGTATETATLRLRISLPAKTLVAGRTIPAALVVNNKRAKLSLRTSNGCKPQIGLVINSEAIPQHLGFRASCDAGALVIPHGQSRIPFDLPVTYLSCHPGGPQGSTPACLANGAMPPLPTGRYQVSLEGDATDLPKPQPVRVRVVNASVDHR